MDSNIKDYASMSIYHIPEVFDSLKTFILTDEELSRHPSLEVEIPWNTGLPIDQQPFYGKSHTEEFKQKMSKIHKGKNITEDHKHRISESKLDIPLKPDHIKKISKSLTGKKRKPFSQEHKDKISKAKSKTKMSDESKKKLSESQKLRWLKINHQH
jgi:hypothetical protein